MKKSKSEAKMENCMEKNYSIYGYYSESQDKVC
jgi:hypothetical protein